MRRSGASAGSTSTSLAVERPDELGEIEISVTPPVRPTREAYAPFEDIGVHRMIPLTPAATMDDVVRFVEELGQLV